MDIPNGSVNQWIPIATIKDRLGRLLNESVAHLHEDFQKFKNGLFKCKDYLFTFLQNPDLPYDNNASERGIRKIKVKQKVSGCFRTEKGANTMNVHSVAETAKKNGISKYKAILAVIEQWEGLIWLYTCVVTCFSTGIFLGLHHSILTCSENGCFNLARIIQYKAQLCFETKCFIE